MRRHWAAFFVALTVALGTGSAVADHFDGDASTGSFNPQLAVVTTNNVVNRPSAINLALTQADHEDPPVVSKLRTPGDWQFDFAGTEQAEDNLGAPTTNCKKAIDGLDNSPNGTGTGTQLDYSKRTDAQFVRAEKIGNSHLEVAADGVTRPGAPATWDGDAAFISFNPGDPNALPTPIAPSGVLCVLLISTDARVTSLPDTNPSPSDDSDDIEGVTEIVFDFPVTQTGSHWQVVADLTDLMQDDTFQTINVSLIRFDFNVFAHSAGNWEPGGTDFSKTPLVSGTKTFEGEFTPCPPADPAFGNCASDKGVVTRTIPKTIILPAPAITAPAPGTTDNDGTITIAGTADPFAQVQVYEAGSSVGAPAVANGSGAWSTDLQFAQGSHTVVARTVDAGGFSADSNPRSFTIDTPPGPPSVTSPSSGEIVGAGTIPVSGDAQPGSTVKLYEGGPVLTQTTANAISGAWSTTVNITGKGPHTLTATSSDAGGESLQTPFTFDVTTAIPIIDAPAEDGAFPVDTISLSGTAEADSILKIFEGGTEIESIITDGAGHWSVDHLFSQGAHAITATATGALDAFVSPPTPVRNFVIDLTPPDAPAISTPLDGADAGSATLAITGTSEGNATILLSEDGTEFAQGVASSGGNWSIPAVLSIGQHTVTAVAKDKAGNLSFASDPRTFNVVQSIIINTPDENSFQPRAVKLSGMSDPASSQVILYEGTTERATVNVTNGAWSTTLSLPEGTHTFTAKSITGGVLSPASTPRTFKVDDTTPVLTLQQPSNGGLAIMMPGEGFAGTASDLGGSGVKNIAISYFNAAGLFVRGQAAICHGCTGQSVTWDAVPNVGPGVYGVQIRAIDAVDKGTQPIQFTIVLL